MKTFFRFLLKPLAFVPALIMIYIIFNFSQQTGDVSAGLSLKVSRKIVVAADELLERNWNESQINHYTEKIHYYVRKAGHVTEYFILAITITLPLYVVFGLRHVVLFLSPLLYVYFWPALMSTTKHLSPDGPVLPETY